MDATGSSTHPSLITLCRAQTRPKLDKALTDDSGNRQGSRHDR